MRHTHTAGDRHRHPHEDAPEHHGRRGRHRGRPFDNGELRLIILHMIGQAPRHGYELIKEIEEAMGGGYSPSPGVIYPTLSLLEELGHARVDAAQPGRKRYTITAEGEEFLAANATPVALAMARLAAFAATRPEATPAPLIRAMENLKLVLKLEQAAGAISAARAEVIAGHLDQASIAIERGRPSPAGTGETL